MKELYGSVIKKLLGRFGLIVCKTQRVLMLNLNCGLGFRQINSADMLWPWNFHEMHALTILHGFLWEEMIQLIGGLHTSTLRSSHGSEKV